MYVGEGISKCVCWGGDRHMCVLGGGTSTYMCVCVCVHVCKCVRWGVGWDKYMCVCVCMSANQSVQLVHVPLSSWHNAVL